MTTWEIPGYSHHPRDFVKAYKLFLPSFGIGIYRSAPAAKAIPMRASPLRIAPEWDTGDAFSITYMYEGEDFLPAVDRSFLPLSRGYLRRILLEILVREEYEEIDRHHLGTLRAKGEHARAADKNLLGQDTFTGPVPRAQVRLSDLRLANAIKPRQLYQELEETLSELVGQNHKVATEEVLRWKHETLRKYKSVSINRSLKQPHEWTEQEEKTEHTRVIAISFAAAALCLLLDLGSSNLRQASLKDLRVSVMELATIIKALTENLDAAMSALGKLTANKRTGRPKTAPLELYTALHLYRMGWPYEELAMRIGINPGTKNWKNRTMNKVKRGVAVEKEKFPRAAQILARRADRRVSDSATREYREYRNKRGWLELEPWIAEAKIGYDLLPDFVPDDHAAERRRAYVQLGSCLATGRDPLPSD